MPRLNIVLLTPIQSVTIHGWFNPKRTISWEDILSDSSITVKRLVVDAKLSQESLKKIQPDIFEWINKKYVSYGDVPHMTGFPLNPISHLHGDISTLVTHRYSAQTLSAVGLTYKKLQSHHLNAKWMKLMNFTLKEWMCLGMNLSDINCMSEGEVVEIFGTCKATITLGIGMAESFG